MRLLLDENIPKIAVDSLREEGHDVEWIHQSRPGSTDKIVLATSVEQRRILVTFDKDFGALALSGKLIPPAAIILVRGNITSPTYVSDRLVQALQQRDDWQGHFSVIEENRIRMTPLPLQEN